MAEDHEQDFTGEKHGLERHSDGYLIFQLGSNRSVIMENFISSSQAVSHMFFHLV
jgi:hypothetical protein